MDSHPQLHDVAEQCAMQQSHKLHGYCMLQSAKSAALGPRRQMEALSEILTEPMLTRFTSEAAKAEETGWFWKYKCNSVKVSFHFQPGWCIHYGPVIARCFLCCFITW